MEKEMTRYAFLSHIEAYLKKLLKDPLHADTDDFLKYYGLDAPKTLALLTKRITPDDENSAIVIVSKSIKDNGVDENGERLPDSFEVKYRIPRKDYYRKMRNLYISLFEENIVDGCPINEEGESGGATSADASGQYSVPLFGKPIKRKTLYITEEQAEYIKKCLAEESVMDTAFGDFGYDAPIGDGKKNKKNKFFADTNNHKNMSAEGWQG